MWSTTRPRRASITRIDMIFGRTASGGALAVDRGEVTGTDVADRDPATGVCELRGQTLLGTLPVRVPTSRIALCPWSEVGSNISGHPPSITVMAC